MSGAGDAFRASTSGEVLSLSKSAALPKDALMQATSCMSSSLTRLVDFSRSLVQRTRTSSRSAPSDDCMASMHKLEGVSSFLQICICTVARNSFSVATSLTVSHSICQGGDSCILLSKCCSCLQCARYASQRMHTRYGTNICGKAQNSFDHFFRHSCTAGLLCPFDRSLLVCDCRLCHTSGVANLIPLGDQAANTFAKFWYDWVWTCFCHRALKWLTVSFGGVPPIRSGCRQPRHFKVSPERYHHQLMPRLHLFGMTLTLLEVSAYWINFGLVAW